MFGSSQVITTREIVPVNAFQATNEVTVSIQELLPIRGRLAGRSVKHRMRLTAEKLVDFARVGSHAAGVIRVFKSSYRYLHVVLDEPEECASPSLTPRVGDAMPT